MKFERSANYQFYNRRHKPFRKIFWLKFVFQNEMKCLIDLEKYRNYYSLMRNGISIENLSGIFRQNSRVCLRGLSNARWRANRRVSRDIFRLAEISASGEMDLTTSLHFPNIIICLISTLSFHDLMIEIPREIHIVLPREKSATVREKEVFANRD